MGKGSKLICNAAKEIVTVYSGEESSEELMDLDEEGNLFLGKLLALMLEILLKGFWDYMNGIVEQMLNNLFQIQRDLEGGG
jgi:hypothetical protein